MWCFFNCAMKTVYYGTFLVTMGIEESKEHEGAYRNIMNIRMVESINNNIDIIIEQWEELMKKEQGDKFFHFMPTNLIEKTSREFAELMTSNISETDVVNSEKLGNFAEKVVRFGWSIKFVNKAIDNFSQIAFGLLEKKEVINQSNLRAYMTLFDHWIDPLRESIIEAYAMEWERTISLQKIALQELSASLIPVVDRISIMPLVGTIDLHYCPIRQCQRFLHPSLQCARCCEVTQINA